ncbi:MAG: putative symporter YjmB [Anaerolineales bacterium]|nr:putative symporter YjmB [Anaerolineales bacterium]
MSINNQSPTANSQQPPANSQSLTANSQQPPANSQTLTFLHKLLYGSGDWGLSSTGMLRSVFYAIYLTDVVGLDARIGSFAALFGIVWDAINDPIVGMISDRVRTKRGRRLPFLLWFGIPFGLSFVLLWWAPPWRSQAALAIHITLAFAIADTLSTLISIPFLSLTPELTPDYDERTTLTSFRTFFQLTSSLAVVIFAPMIVDGVMAAGASQQQGFLLVGAVFGGLAIPPYLIMPFVFKERTIVEEPKPISLREMLRTAWANRPFRFLAGVHTMNWSAVDMVAVTFPYFSLYWIAQGDPLAGVNIFGFHLALESAILGTLMLTTVCFVPFWMWLSKRTNKRRAYLTGMIFWVINQVLILTVQPGEVTKMLAFSVLLGIGLSSAYVLPDSMFPDIIEWDELKTNRRQEGIYYGARAFIRKLASALTVFITLQLLGWAGYVPPSDDTLQFTQSESTLTMIRLMVSPISAVILSGAILSAWFYPLTREKHAKIRELLEKKRSAVGD